MQKYNNLSKEELLNLVDKQDQELKAKKYGLVWDAEREPEQVVLDCANNLPVLKRVKGKEIKTDDSDDNILIEGDNYHALTVLNYTHKEKVDVIYIDPPYNTGNKDFIYNDECVEKENSYRHSKWLNFMEKRLNLVKGLLKKTGVIFISIDDNEMAQLKLLCDRVFGETNFVTQFIWHNNVKGRQMDLYIKNTYENILMYAKNVSNLSVKLEKDNVDINSLEHDEVSFYKKDYPLHNGTADFHINNRPNLAYTIYYNAKNNDVVVMDEKIRIEEGYAIGDPKRKDLLKKGYIRIIPKYNTKYNNQRVWRWGKDKLLREYKTELIFVKEADGMYIYQKKRFDDKGCYSKKYKNYINIDGGVGKNELLSILGKKIFDNPKSSILLKHLLEIVVDKDSIILDFFAGSGTTGHAVLDLNKEDGGNRKFILCTNNELNGYEKELKEKGMSEKEIKEYGICRRVTYPRLEKVIKGYKKNGDGEKVEGLGGNLQYFRTGLVKTTKNKDQVRLDLTKKCVEMLCVKENIFNLEIEEGDYKICSSNKKDKFLCVYFNLFDKSFEDFLIKIKKIKGEKVAYVFSLDNEVDKKLFSGIDNLKIEAIPQEILNVYDKIVKMNIPVKTEIIFTLFEKAKKQVFEEEDKDDGAKNLRIVLEKILQKIAQMNRIEIYNDKQKEIKISKINDTLKQEKIISQTEWEEIRTYLTIGNKASHGEFDEYNLDQIKNFIKVLQSLINKFNIQ
ncbi:site-specific DNA-methyltransferase [bacterium]|nr:MAG: site-specific DNA-methyltransferase [bacterium]